MVHDDFDWGDDEQVRPRHLWTDTIVYEAHVKGFTRQHSEVPEEIRGTYAGLTTNAAVHYLKDLGITTVELLPVHQFVSSPTSPSPGSRTTGATTRSGSSHRTTPTARLATRASRSSSSRRWSRRCTGPGSR